jgi:hypothetical protein
MTLQKAKSDSSNIQLRRFLEKQATIKPYFHLSAGFLKQATIKPYFHLSAGFLKNKRL